MAVPEKYFTPSFVLAVQNSSFASWIWGGAPRPGGKEISHGPATVARVSVWVTGDERTRLEAGCRKTTNTDSR